LDKYVFEWFVKNEMLFCVNIIPQGYYYRFFMPTLSTWNIV
jgi:hypothetical protein